ncbi:hypothetical protein JFT81_00740 [Pseudomonas sp. TH43]|uniref:hypothetical protein n=1 Tax=Pseudomonas sp. TH43 TaxID=2796407 RepID=UPI001912B6AE|nr:hypothetical protein [Pseudomonas sp. TH43]MBK5373160.1 hypothetical protein [Pseudomonas sp. TH43]
MQLSFRSLSSITSSLCFFLALVWGFVPDMLLAIWSIEYSEGAGVVARRSAVLFAALGCMFYWVRKAPVSVARNALSNGFIVGCFGLAVLGFGEWLNGNAGPGILLAVLVEFALGLGFVQARRVTVELGETLG